MQTSGSTVIDALGGTTVVARLVKAPVSTVHSWRKNGIPQSRLDHVKLAARAKRLKVGFDALLSPAASARPPVTAAEQVAA